MENSKRNWKLSEKAKNPRSQWEIGCGEIETFWKQQDLFCFSQKNCPFSCQIPESGRESGHQVGETALKWLDNAIKPRPKIVWWNCKFSTIQQRKKPATSFLSQAYGATGRIRTSGLPGRRTTTRHVIWWYIVISCWFCTALLHLSAVI